MNKKMKRLLGKNEFYVALIIIILATVIQAASGLFFAVNNVVDLLRSIVVNAIYALCALLAFVSTGADVSFPMIAGMSTYIVFKLGETTSLPAPVLVLIALLIGALCGCVNGFFIVKFHFNSLIVTLATSSICYGIAFGALKGVRIDVPAQFSGFANWNILQVKSAQTGLGASLHGGFAVMILLYLIAYFVLRHTMVGRAVYAIGGDEISARRAGFKVDQIRFGIFVVNGMIAVIGGLCYACMCKNCSPMEYYGGEMIVIAAIVLGGVRLTGGHGSLLGCMLGTFLLGMVSNSLTMIGISVYYQKVFIGIIIIIGASVAAVQAKRAMKISNVVKSEG
ncbi:MAG: ABC transporter permease [Lachnospiraceae bacterium]|nr:ABC transporter permease [Lachnospiraceae bacterium]